MKIRKRTSKSINAQQCRTPWEAEKQHTCALTDPDAPTVKTWGRVHDPDRSAPGSSCFLAWAAEGAIMTTASLNTTSVEFAAFGGGETFASHARTYMGIAVYPCFIHNMDTSTGFMLAFEQGYHILEIH